jgi:hypothetical protein
MCDLHIIRVVSIYIIELIQLNPNTAVKDYSDTFLQSESVQKTRGSHGGKDVCLVRIALFFCNFIFDVFIGVSS